MVEAQGVVDGPQVAVEAGEDVARLAVCVVGHQVEGGQATEVGYPVRVVVEGEVVLLVVARHVQLDRSLSERAVADDRRGDQTPPEEVGQLPRRGLPPVQAGGEVVEGPFAASRLVDALD